VALASSPPRPSGLAFAKLGALFFYAFNHVPLAVTVESGSIGALAGTGFAAATGTLSVTPLAGTALVLWLLGRAGRRVAGQAGAAQLGRAAQGAKVALPYALLSGVAALALQVSVPVGGGRVALSPSTLGAFLWPAALAVAAGAIGGARSADRGGSGLRAVRDGLRTLAIALALAVAGLVVLAPLHPDATASYFDAFHTGLAAGLSRVALTLAVLPNLALWVLFPSMGGCLSLTTEQAGGGLSVCLLSYTQFPPSGGISGVAVRGPGFDFPPPPPAFFLFVLVPVVATLGGGWLAARRAVFTGRRPVVAATASGVAFAAGAVAFGFLSRARVEVAGAAGGTPETVAATVGPDLLLGAVVALAWGVGGAVLGVASRRRGPPDPGGPSSAP
jgi:hypothetical protein